MTVAYVLSGGASLGSVQAGMALALEEEGVRPDFVIGTSVGSLNGAWLAAGKSAAGLVEVWKHLTKRQIFPLHPLVGLRGFLGHHSYLVPNAGLRQVVQTHVPFGNIEDAEIPFSVIATDASNGNEVRIESGSVVDAVLASSAIPGVFPPIQIGGRTLIDGGIAANAPISHAIASGATEVWVLSTGYSCALPEPPGSAIAMALHAIGLLVNQRFRIETEHRTFPVNVHLIPAPCPIAVAPNDFSQSEELADRAKRGTLQWIRNGEPHAIPWPLHSHD